MECSQNEQLFLVAKRDEILIDSEVVDFSKKKVI